MKYLITIALLGSAALLAWINFYAPSGDLAGNTISVTGKVVDIIDGDSFKIRTEEGLRRVELHGLDAPEPDQPWGAMSTYYLTDLIDGREVQISQISENEYGDIIGIVMIDGLTVNRLMLSQGYAWATRGSSRDKMFIGLESMAREGGLGLWRQNSPTSPWEWRERKLDG